MNALTFTLRLQQPLLLGQVGAGEENSAISIDYIAGSAIRGALIGRYIAGNDDFDLTKLAADDPIRRLFFNNEVLFLNAYLQDDHGYRTLPTPLSWQVEKDEPDLDLATVVDAAIGDLDELDDPKPLRGRPFCAIDEENILTLYNPKRQNGLHNASTQRYVKQESDSFVFRYNALAAEQTFCGVILSEDATLLSQLQELLAEPDLFLGGSRSAGYGHTVLSNPTVEQDWTEYRVPEVDDPPATVTLTLLSDAIIRDDCGQFTTDLFALPAMKSLHEQLQASFVVTGLTGGFNRKWGLPMPQSPVLRAGSVWTFDTAAEADLQALVNHGIGERRSDGFGRAAVKWQQYEILSAQQPIREPQARQSITLSDTSQPLAGRMAERLYRQQLDQLLLAAVSQSKFIIGGTVPENSQLSRLRVIVRQAWRTQNGDLVHQFLSKLKPLARNQYLRAQIEDQSLLDWLEQGWPDKLWTTYFSDTKRTLPRIGDVQASVTNEIKVEYCARLVDALCARTIRIQQAAEARDSQAEGVRA